MPLPHVPTDSSNERQHRTVIATATNELVKLRQPNDPKEEEAASRITPIDLRYPYLSVERYADFQTALNQLLAAGGTLTLEKGKTYTLGNTNLTLLRTAAGHARRMVIEGNGAIITFTGLASGSALKIGADGQSNFVEGGQLVIRDVTLQGPETGSTVSDDPSTTTVGLEMAFAGSVLLENVKCPGFHTGFRSKFAFPVKTFNCSGRRSWVGWWHDEVSNLIEHENFEAPECRYSFVIKSDSTSLDDGKTNNITFRKSWVEGAQVGWAIDSGSGGSGAVRFRNITIVDPYVANTEYDVIRIGVVMTFATPETRGANCSEFINDFRVTDGLWNPTSGAWSATSAAIVYDSVRRVRHALVDIPVYSKALDSDVFVNGPAGGVVRTKAFPGLGDDGIITEDLYNDQASIVRRFHPNGNIMLGDQKATLDDNTETGVEIKNGGQVDLTTEGSAVLRLNRKTSTGTLAAFYQASTLVGTIEASSGNISFIMNSAGTISWGLCTGDPEGVIAASVGSMRLRTDGGAGTTLYIKESGVGNTGWIAK